MPLVYPSSTAAGSAHVHSTSFEVLVGGAAARLDACECLL